MSPKEPLCDLMYHENAARLAGHLTIAGIDEAGRGPLAGPVVAACVVLPVPFDLSGINDSKLLSASQRECAFARIHVEARAIGVCRIDADEIDRINILRASWSAIRGALSAIEVSPDLVLVDGLPIPNLPCAKQQAIVGGDRKSATIAAASIVAKVTRDRLMVEFDQVFPGYGFARHKGYASKDHLDAIRLLGPCPVHRRSFAPVANALAVDCATGLFAK